MTANPTRTLSTERRQRLGLLAEPLGYVDGQNLYEYVGGDPVASNDPLGLEAYVRTEDIEARSDLSSKAETDWASHGTILVVVSGGRDRACIVSVSDEYEVLVRLPTTNAIKRVFLDPNRNPGKISPVRTISEEEAQGVRDELLAYEMENNAALTKKSWDTFSKLTKKSIARLPPAPRAELEKAIQSEFEDLLRSHAASNYQQKEVDHERMIKAGQRVRPMPTREEMLNNLRGKVRLIITDIVPDCTVPRDIA